MTEPKGAQLPCASHSWCPILCCAQGSLMESSVGSVRPAAEGTFLLGVNQTWLGIR